MRENYTLTRLYIEADLQFNAELTLQRAQTHYLSTVLRKSAGEIIRLFNGRDGEWAAEIVSLEKRTGKIRLTKRLREHRSAPDIHLLFAPVRKHRTTFILEKATELGVSDLFPIITARTQFPRLNLEKGRLQIIEAAEQTERLDIPTLHSPRKLNDLLDHWGQNRRIIFADEGGGCLPAKEAISSLTGPMSLLVGPEGGFVPKERDRLLGMDCVTPVSLGPRILRADTAALSLLTVWQSVHGDWSPC